MPALLRARVAGAAAVLVKSNWYYVPDEFMRTFAADWGLANVALQVAGSQPPPWLDQDLEALQGGAERSLGVSPDAEFAGSAPLGRGLNASVPFYRVLFYETPWYEPRARAPLRRRGVRRRRRNHVPGRRGGGAGHRRPLRGQVRRRQRRARAVVGALRGLRRVAVGDYEPLEAYAEGPRIVADLRAGGVDVRSPGRTPRWRTLPPDARRRRAESAPGRRRAGGAGGATRCGCEVHVFADNSKLAGLLKGPVPGAAEYATRLARGLACAAGDAGACAEACPRFQAAAGRGRRRGPPAAVPRPRRRARGPPVRRGQTGDRVESSPRGRRGRHRGRSRRRAARPGRARRRARPLRAALAGKRGWSELDDLVSSRDESSRRSKTRDSRSSTAADMAPSPHRDRALAAWAADRGPGRTSCRWLGAGGAPCYSLPPAIDAASCRAKKTRGLDEACAVRTLGSRRGARLRLVTRRATVRPSSGPRPAPRPRPRLGAEPRGGRRAARAPPGRPSGSTSDARSAAATPAASSRDATRQRGSQSAR